MVLLRTKCGGKAAGTGLTVVQSKAHREWPALSTAPAAGTLRLSDWRAVHVRILWELAGVCATVSEGRTAPRNGVNAYAASALV